MEPEIAAFQRTPPSDSGTPATVRSASPAASVWPPPSPLTTANIEQTAIERLQVRTFSSHPAPLIASPYCRHCRHSLFNPQSQNGAQVSTLETRPSTTVKSTPPRIQLDHDAQVLLATSAAIILTQSIPPSQTPALFKLSAGEVEKNYSRRSAAFRVHCLPSSSSSDILA